MFRLFVVELFCLTCCGLTACAAATVPSSRAQSVLADRIEPRAQHCEQVSIEELWNNPAPHAEKRICVSGYLGHMVPYGEESADLFSSAEQAKSRQSDHYITLSLPLTMKAQEELASYSDRKLDAVGTFHFDRRCWPQSGEKESQYQCFPPRPMKLLNAIVALGR